MLKSTEFCRRCPFRGNRVKKCHYPIAPHNEDILSDNSMEEMLEDENTTLQIHQILHHMEEPYKEVFQLRIFGELSFQKIGQIFGKSESWARVTYHRAKLKIQERIGENGEKI